MPAGAFAESIIDIDFDDVAGASVEKELALPAVAVPHAAPAGPIDLDT